MNFLRRRRRRTEFVLLGCRLCEAPDASEQTKSPGQQEPLGDLHNVYLAASRCVIYSLVVTEPNDDDDGGNCEPKRRAQDV